MYKSLKYSVDYFQRKYYTSLKCVIPMVKVTPLFYIGHIGTIHIKKDEIYQRK